jgi:hypothetical protein
MSEERFFIGVDPGQSIDPTAISAVRIDRSQQRPVFQCGHLERLPLNTPYPGVIWRVGDLQARLSTSGSRAEVVLDLTGVGRAVGDLFVDRGIHPTNVTITAGHEETKTGPGHYSVPKLQLVSRVQALLHDSRLLIQKDLPDTPALVAELQEFRASVTDSGRWSFGARSGAHDDLVLALSLACWRASKPTLFVGDALRARLTGRRVPMLGKF